MGGPTEDVLLSTTQPLCWSEMEHTTVPAPGGGQAGMQTHVAAALTALHPMAIRPLGMLIALPSLDLLLCSGSPALCWGWLAWSRPRPAQNALKAGFSFSLLQQKSCSSPAGILPVLLSRCPSQRPLPQPRRCVPATPEPLTCSRCPAW